MVSGKKCRNMEKNEKSASTGYKKWNRFITALQWLDRKK